jgi:hypothetical protein
MSGRRFRKTIVEAPQTMQALVYGHQMLVEALERPREVTPSLELVEREEDDAVVRDFIDGEQTVELGARR